MKAAKPLSPHALGALARLGRRPLPCSEINPGVADRLMREGLIEQVELPSPFASHKGKRIGHYQLKAKP